MGLAFHFYIRVKEFFFVNLETEFGHRDFRSNQFPRMHTATALQPPRYTMKLKEVLFGAESNDQMVFQGQDKSEMLFVMFIYLGKKLVVKVEDACISIALMNDDKKMLR